MSSSSHAVASAAMSGESGEGLGLAIHFGNAFKVTGVTGVQGYWCMDIDGLLKVSSRLDEGIIEELVVTCI